jgi:hypothetical protein
MKLQFFYLLPLIVFGANFACYSQEVKSSPTPPPASSVQFINATSVSNIKLDIKDFHQYPKLAQGAKISGGHFPFTTWKLRAQKADGSDEKAIVEKTFQKSPSTASTVVIIGNFEWKIEEEGKKKTLQAAILNFDHELGAEDKPNSLTIVNGLVDKILRVSINAAEFEELPPLSHKTYRGLPAKTETTGIVGSKEMKLPIKFNAALDSGIVAFYEKDGSVEFVASPQSRF